MYKGQATITKTLNFLLAGVGGQGTILAGDVLVNVGMAAGYQVKQAEVHGMSQRGSVTSYVRWAKRSIRRWWAGAKLTSASRSRRPRRCEA